MQILFLLLLMQDTLSSSVHQQINLPAPPIGGTKNDWLGYGISVGVTLLIGVITRIFEKRKMKSNFKAQQDNVQQDEK